MKVLLAFSLLLNIALTGWIAADLSRKVKTVHSDDYLAVSEKLGLSLLAQAEDIQKQVALRDDLAHGDKTWLESEERRDLLLHAKELGDQGMRAREDAGTIPPYDPRDIGK